MQCSFKGKKVLVTGAARGIGKDLVKALVAEEAVVYALSKNAENLKQLEAECPGIKTIQCDLADWEATEKALEPLDPLDHLVNNAGVAQRVPFSETTEELYDLTFNVNVKSMINVTKIVSKKMIAAGKKGTIVNVSSCSAIKPTVGMMVYCASKAAVDMVTKCMALELAPHKIRVNSVNPTLIITDMGLSIWNTEIDSFREYLPLKEFPSLDSSTKTIMFLLSDLSEYVTGSPLVLDSGLLLK